MTISVESLVLSNLVLKEDYARKVLPFLKEDYFQSREDKTLFLLAATYITKYNAQPTKDALHIDLSKLKNVNEGEFRNIKEKIDGLAINKDDPQWLLDQTEEFCKWQAIKNALFQSIAIIEGKDTKAEKGVIPKIMSDALAVSFDPNVGHDFLENSQERFDRYRRHEERVPFDLSLLNKITGGGLPKSTLNVIVASTGVGKSLAMSHMAAGNLMGGLNVLYITLEMGEIGDPSISQRIDANLLDISLDELATCHRDTYTSRLNNVTSKTKGKLIIKGYPTASAGSANFRFLINELRLKKDFVPDIIYVDYLNICTSSRMRMGSNVGSYTYIKSIAEELRGLAQEFDVPLMTATQLNREGSKHSDPEMEHTAESWGLPATADFMIAIISNDQLKAANQFMVKQLKNRYADVTKYGRFVIGVNTSKMRLYDAPTSEQTLNDKNSTRAMAASRSLGIDAAAFLDFK